MTRINSPQLRQLLIQARFAPEDKRLLQIDACEALIRLIQPGHQYPFEFVCFHLTGYRPHSGKIFQSDNLLHYNDLIADIPAYAAQLSRICRIPARSFKQKFYTIETLTRRFQVCRKTISRWRHKGLVGLYLLFPDGQLRLAFRASSVEYYVGKNKRKVISSKSFNKISPEQRQVILHRLARWSRRCPNHRQQAIQRTAHRYNRSVETIRMLVSYAEKNGFANIHFNRRPYSIPDDQRRQLYLLYQQGLAVKELTSRFNRSKTSIYHAINMEQAYKLLETKIFYMSSPEFSAPGEKDHLLHPDPGLFPAGTTDNSPNSKAGSLAAIIQPKEVIEPISAYINDICSTDLLNAQQEHFLFRRYNYEKFRAAQLQRLLDRNHPSAWLISKIRLYLQKAQEDKNFLIRSNLRLVVSIARRHVRNEAEMLELISEGNMALMNSIEKFDFNRGLKLSTYATWAIVKRYATLRTKQSKQPVHEVSDELLEVAQDMRVQESRVLVVESARKSLEEVMAERLEEREQKVVREHYGLIKQTEITGQRKARSLNQIAKLLGISKERVRQIELLALQKLRRVLSREQFDVLTQGSM